MGQAPAGIRWLHVHPIHLIDEEDLTIVQAAKLFEENGVLPEPGGLLDQAAATIASIRVVIAAWNKLRAARRQVRER